MTLLEPASQVLVRFRALGIPTPAGSKVPFLAGGHARLKEMNEQQHTEWRNIVSNEAFEAAKLLPRPLDGALVLEVTFRFPMPAVRARSLEARTRRQLPKISAPDTDKLVRSIGDSIQAAGLVKDDARFATVFATKIEVLEQWTGAEITIRRLA